MFYPKNLKKGEIIKLISPSNGTKQEKTKLLNYAIEVLKKCGYSVVEDKYTRYSENGASAGKLLRAKELNKSFKDKSSALISVSGGDFMNQIMDKINFKNFLNNAKWIQGHSDITMLLYYLTTNYDIATIYNFNVRGYSTDNKKVIEYAISALENKLLSEESLTDWEVINHFHNVKGRIIGGCLESLKDIIGTKYDSFKKFEKKYKKDGIIWYFDVSSFSNEDISRTLWQLKIMGYFKNCKAIIFGKLHNEKTFTGLTLKDAINNELGDLNIPIIINCDLGHIDQVITIINGSIVKIIKKRSKFLIEVDKI